MSALQDSDSHWSVRQRHGTLVCPTRSKFTFIPNNPDMIFETKVARLGRRSLKIDRDIPQPLVYQANDSSISSSSSMMQTAIDYDSISDENLLMMPTSAVSAIGENKESMLDDISYSAQSVISKNNGKIYSNI